ncbi:YDG domain-containing protein [Rufibacter hautae]|uniref:T9SS type A sorting domain-containing protein n=1 Tax=Rufibacter hautae TaxID=2595005 RepID=A0A5B6TAK4_9BACT|nr:YDG domain-containing protein [Rufibacter hautae]KAA3436099.1 T9SS type A sorting domain-containing protein [Rufibacter hautae]
MGRTLHFSKSLLLTTLLFLVAFYAEAQTINEVIVGSQTGVATYGTTSNVTYVVSVSLSGNKNNNYPVSLSVTNLPPNVSATFNPSPLMIQPDNNGNAKIQSTTLTLTIPDNANLVLSPHTFTVTATANTSSKFNTGSLSINKKTITGSFTVNDKVYDGGVNAAIASRTLTGVIGTDDVSLSGGTATFATSATGSNKIVTATGLTLTGSTAGKYTLSSTSATTTASITPKPISSTITVSNKVYDGGFTATILTRSLTGVIQADILNVSLTGGTASFNDKNVGVGKTVTATGLGLTGTASGNYSLSSTTASTTANITHQTITITGVSAVSRPYNGTLTTILTGTPILNGKITGDAVTANGSAAIATFASKTAGPNKPVTVTGYTLIGGDANNYSLSQPANLTAAISALPIEGYITVEDKQYDGNTSATITSRNLTGILSPDDVSYVGGTATFNDKNVGTGKTVTATGLSLTGGDAVNYIVNTTATATASITARALTVTATAQSKEYDGNTSATVALASNKLSGDQLTLSSASAVFADKNVGTGKTVTVDGITFGGTDAANYSLSNTTTTTTANITAKALTLTGVSVGDKVYDATTIATLSGTPSLEGIVGNDEVSVDPASTANASFITKAVGNNKPVAPGYTLTGADAGNYTITSNLTANITPLAITGSIKAADKVYDGNATASITERNLAGVLSEDKVTYTGGTGTFSDKNVGTDKTVTSTGLSLTGVDAGNYTVNSTATTLASITGRSLTVTASAQNKEYDGNTTATVTLSSNKLGSDIVTTAFTSATFADKNIGTKAVTVAGITIEGLDAGNYTLVNTTATTTATITAKALTIANAVAGNKVYDKTTTASISGTLNGVVGTEDVSLNLSGTFATSDVGTGIAVTSTSTIGGNDRGNYTLTQPSGLKANITAIELTVADARANNKVYDGSSDATITGTLVGVLLGDNVTLTRSGTFASRDVGTHEVTSTSVLAGTDKGNYTLTNPTGLTATITAKALTIANAIASNKEYDGTDVATITGTLTGVVSSDINKVTLTRTGTFATKDVGINIAVTSTGTLSGTEAHNYSLTQPTGLKANITARALTLNNIVANDKVYDGTTAATISGTLTGILPGETVTWLGTGTFASALVNRQNRNSPVQATIVTYNTGTLAGANANNYSLASFTPGTLSAKITPKVLEPVVTTAEKVYDGTTLFTSTAENLIGVIPPDHVSLYINSQTSVVTDGTQTLNLSIGSSDQNNYDLFPTSITIVVKITPRPLTITASGSTKVYDGNDNASVTLLDNRITGDVLTIAHTSAKFDNKNVGTGKQITINGLSITGTKAANYTLSNTAAQTTGSITPRPLTINGITANSKEYDGTTDVFGFSGTATLSNQIQGDDITFTGAPVGTFASKNAGVRAVNVTGFTKGGNDAGNYNFSQPTGLSAEITRRVVTGTFRADNKVYDGTNSATVTTNSRGLDRKIAGDLVSLDGGTATFNDATPDVDKVVTLTGATLVGDDRGNYNLTSVATALATIEPTPLPVTLISFTAKAQKEGVLLNWTTATEKDNDFFQVERSADGKNFSAIGQVKGNGTSNVRVDYNFLDGKALSGTAYYRLKQVDYDGKFEYSKTLAVQTKAVAATQVMVKAYPNPTPDAVNLDLTQAASSEVKVGVFALDGRLVKTLTLTGGKVQRLDLTDVAVGTYLVKLAGDDVETVIRVVRQ